MFVRNKVIDKERIKDVILKKKLMTYESVKKEWRLELKERGDVSEVGAFNYCDAYERSFTWSLADLTLDELEYLNNHNLFQFKQDNLLDYRCKKVLVERIKTYKDMIDEITNFMQSGKPGSYFQKFGNLLQMSYYGLTLVGIMGLERENAILTPDGKELLACVYGIERLFLDSIHGTDNEKKPIK